MNNQRFSGVVVFDGDRAVGMLTDRSLLRKFVGMNKRPDEVKVSEVMAPLLRIDAGASTKEAALVMIKNQYARIGVFDGEKFLGWVTYTDLARETSKKNMLNALQNRNQPEIDYVCPKCRKAVLTKVANEEGRILRWECSNCRFVT